VTQRDVYRNQRPRFNNAWAHDPACKVHLFIGHLRLQMVTILSRTGNRPGIHPAIVYSLCAISWMALISFRVWRAILVLVSLSRGGVTPWHLRSLGTVPPSHRNNTPTSPFRSTFLTCRMNPSVGIDTISNIAQRQSSKVIALPGLGMRQQSPDNMA
jgi:hypothetical protein